MKRGQKMTAEQRLQAEWNRRLAADGLAIIRPGTTITRSSARRKAKAARRS